MIWEIKYKLNFPRKRKIFKNFIEAHGYSKDEILKIFLEVHSDWNILELRTRNKKDE